MFLQPRKSRFEGGYRVSIRDRAGSPNTCVPRCSKLSAIELTARTICERLVLVQGPREFAHFFTVPSAPTPPTLILSLFLDSPVFFPLNLLNL